jgi:hypothetical protein
VSFILRWIPGHRFNQAGGAWVKTASEVARLFDVNRDVVKTWCYHFAEHLSPDATPPKGQVRRFTEYDLRVLAVIYYYWEDDPDYENIHACLNSGEQNEEHYLEFALLHTPLFRDPPEDLDESSYGALIGGMAAHNMLDAARSFNRVLGELFTLASNRYEPHELDYPIFYICRHTLELYLKVLLDGDLDEFMDKHRGAGQHDLQELIRAVETKYGASLPDWAKDRILDFHKIDPKGDLFRFGDWEPEGGEWWTNFGQLQTVMERLCEAFEFEIGKRKQGT